VGYRGKLKRFVTIASSRLPLVEAKVSFQKLRKVSFGKKAIASTRDKT